MTLRSLSPAALLAFLAVVPTPADAAEVQFDGYYRARFRVYDTLSLNRDLTESEGLAAYAQHRFWLRPQFLISDNTAVYADILGLDNVLWGDSPAGFVDPTITLPDIFDDRLTAPVPEDQEDLDQTLVDITLWRAWAEIDTPIGQFGFGRMPVHWGLGIWRNDGLGWNDDYGDSADRVEWSHIIENVFVEAAVEAIGEGALNDPADDVMSYNASFGYRSELVTSGITAQLRRTSDLNLFIIDGALQAEVGNIDIGAEAIGQFGGGTFEEVNEARFAAAGAVLTARLNSDMLDIALEGGLATGDADPTDQDFRAFAFDPDYNVGIILFEQPMPVFTGTGSEDRDVGSALLGTSVSNAMYVRPSVSRNLFLEGLDGELAVIAARTAKVSERDQDRRGYGIEVDGTVSYSAFENFDVTGTAAVFLPGSYFENFESATLDGLDDPVYAGQIIGQVRF